jgi:hypothetical protein
MLIIRQAGGRAVLWFACFLKFAALDSPGLPRRIEPSGRLGYSQVTDNNLDQAKEA